MILCANRALGQATSSTSISGQVTDQQGAAVPGDGDQFHGSGNGYYFANNVVAANTWVNIHTPATVNGVSYLCTPLPKNHRSRFGTSLCGG
jgi:hypothetical protein